MRLKAVFDNSGEYLCAKCKAPYMVYATFYPYVSCGECGWIPFIARHSKLQKILGFLYNLFKHGE